MKDNIRKFLAVLTASAILFGQPVQPVLAESASETAAATETQAAATETQAPATETQAAATETQAAATETQAPATETQAAATETQAAATETQAPATETQTASSATETAGSETETTETAAVAESETSETQTDTSQTVNETETAAAPEDGLIIDDEAESRNTSTESETVAETESETESETEIKSVGSFTYKGKGYTAVLEFTDGSVYPENYEFSVEEVSEKERKNAESLLRAQTDHGHRELADYRDYRVSFRDGENDIPLTKAARLTVTYDNPLSLGLKENKNARAEVFAIDTEAVWIYNPETDGNLCVISLQFSASSLKNFAVAGVTDLVNDGAAINSQELLNTLSGLHEYAVAANSYSQEKTGTQAADPEEIAAGTGAPETESEPSTGAEPEGAADEDEDTKTGSADTLSETSPDEDEKTGSGEDSSLNAQQIAQLLSDLSAASLKFANAQESDTVAVVNLFADEQGKFDESPLGSVLTGGALDVTSRNIVINLVASSQTQSLNLPTYNIVNNAIPAGADENTKAAATQGRVIYNVTALDGNGSYIPYRGTASLKNKVSYGTYMAPEGSISVEGQLVGAVYAGNVHISATGSVTMSVIGGNPEESETGLTITAQSEVTTETETAQSEETTEPVTAQSEKTTEPGTETEIAAAENTVLTFSSRLNGTDIPGTYSITVNGTVLTGDDGGNPLTLSSSEGVPASLDLAAVLSQLAEAAGNASAGEDGSISISLVVTCASDNTDIYTAVSEKTVNVTLSPDGKTITAVDPSDGALVFDYQEKPVLRAGAVDADSAGTAVNYLKGASFRLTAVTESGTTELATATADETSGIAFLHFDPTQIPSGATLQLEETVVPDGYYISDTSHPRILTFNGIKITDSQPVQISNKTVNLTWNIESTASMSDGTQTALSGAVFTVEDENGNALADIYGNTLTITSGANDPVQTTVDPSDYALFADMQAGDSRVIQIAETVIPDGYISTVEGRQENTGCPVQSFTVIKNEDGSYRIEGAAEDQPFVLSFTHRTATKLTLNIQTTDDEEKPAALAGAQYTVRLADGTPLKDSDGASILIESTTIGQPQQIVLDETANPELEELSGTDTLELILSEITVPDGYTFTKSVYGEEEETTLDRTLTVVRSTNGQLAFQDNTTVMDVQFIHTKQSTLSSNDVIRVRKALMNNKLKAIYAVQDLDYYFALFTKEGVRVSGVEKLTVRRGYSAVTSTLFTGLTLKKYVVRETDRYGNPLSDKGAADPRDTTIRAVYHASSTEDGVAASALSYSAGNKVNVTFTAKNKKETQRVSFADSYESAKYPEYFSSSAYEYIVLRKIMLSPDGSEYQSKDTVYFRIDYAAGEEKAGTKILSGHYTFQGRSSASITVPISMSKINADTEVTVTETDSLGNALDNSGKYTVTYSKTTLSPRNSEEKGNGYDTVTITNRLNSYDDSELSQDDVSDDYGDGKAKLTLTKKVTYKGRNMRVNSVYYIGIWRNASLSGDPYYVRALTFKNASQVSATLTINLNKAEGNKVTFYFAEVDENGNRLSSGSDFGYDISQNKTSVTLKAGNMSDEVVFTNSIVSGSSVETSLTDAYSGFAGDSSALAEAQELSSSGTVTSAKTGDTTPLVPLIAAVCVSAVIIIVLLVIRRRRKRGNQNQHTM